MKTYLHSHMHLCARTHTHMPNLASKVCKKKKVPFSAYIENYIFHNILQFNNSIFTIRSDGMGNKSQNECDSTPTNL